MTPAERPLGTSLYRILRTMEDAMHLADPVQDMVYIELAEVALDALCPKGERVELDRTGDTDRLAEPFNIELLTERLRLANAQLLAYDGDPRVRPRLEAKAEGVRLALSYISDMTREDGPDE